MVEHTTIHKKGQLVAHPVGVRKPPPSRRPIPNDHFPHVLSSMQKNVRVH
jgi:hypothetical protein